MVNVDSIADSSYTITGAVSTAYTSWFSVSKIPYNQAAIIGEKVAARYQTTAGNNFTTGGAYKIVDFGTKHFDTHGAVTTGASWKFTAPKSGIYRVSSQVWWSPTTSTAAFNLTVHKNNSGTPYCTLNYTSGKQLTTTNATPVFSGSDLISLNAEEYIDIRVLQGTGGDLALYSGSSAGFTNYVNIESI